MTQEEKAKRYDEAIERAKSKIKGNKDHVLYEDDVIEIFPELKESKENDDEKVRNEIIAFVEQAIHRGGGTPIPQEQENSWIAWLEKQGEQKSMKTCAEYYNQDNELKMPELSVFQNKLADILMQREYEGSTETEEDVASARLDYELAAIRISEELLPLAIMQKPAEWNEEDEGICIEAIKLLTNPSLYEVCVNLRTEIVDWLNSLKGRVQLQPKQQWSEEDERMFNSALWHVKNSCGNGGKNSGEFKVYNWLKSLKDRLQR